MKHFSMLAVGIAAVAITAACSRGGAEQRQPGEWESVVTLKSMEIPGAPPQMAEMMRGRLGQSQTGRECLTPEKARDPLGDMRRMLSQGSGQACTFGPGRARRHLYRDDDAGDDDGQCAGRRRRADPRRDRHADVHRGARPPDRRLYEPGAGDTDADADAAHDGQRPLGQQGGFAATFRGAGDGHGRRAPHVVHCLCLGKATNGQGNES